MYNIIYALILRACLRVEVSDILIVNLVFLLTSKLTI